VKPNSKENIGCWKEKTSPALQHTKFPEKEKKKMHIPEPKTLFIGPPKRRTSQFSDGSFQVP
jgi:hypothetical protein